MTVWVWRSGREEERDGWAIEHSLAGGGWDRLPIFVRAFAAGRVFAERLGAAPRGLLGESPVSAIRCLLHRVFVAKVRGQLLYQAIATERHN